MIGGFSLSGEPQPMTPDRFAAVTEQWVVTAGTPSEVANILNVARSLYCHGFFVYEFVTVAVQHSFVALEAALAHRLGRPDDDLGVLIKRAHRERLLRDDDFALLYEAARPLRNGFSHARDQEVWTPGMAAPVISRIFATITSLWP